MPLRNSPGGEHANARRRHPYRPRLELLEGRCLPSTVTNLTDHDPGSLRDAIATTPAGGTVDFQPGLSGTITLTTGELDIGKNLTIAGPGADVITVSGNDASRVFEVAATFTVNICGLTIAHGSVTDGNGGGIYNSGTLNVASCVLSDNSVTGTGSVGLGGGVYSSGGTLTVTNSTLTGNSAGTGGGIFNERSTASVAGSTLSGNSADRNGGGIFDDGTLTVTNSTLSDNSALGGGAIDNTLTLTLTDSTLSDNSADSGGGIQGADLSTTTVTGCTLSGNSASGVFSDNGGAIYEGGTLTVTNSTFSGNSADRNGGGIFNFGTLTITNSTFSANSANGAVEGGGAIFNNDGRLTLSNSTLNGNYAVSSGGGMFVASHGMATVTDSTLSGNSAGAYGGGIYNSGSDNLVTLTVTSSTLSDNSARAYGGGIYDNGNARVVTVSRNTLLAGNTAPSSPDLYGLLNSQGHNLIGDGTGGSGFDPTDLVGTADNPIDPKLVPLQDNGGLTLTMALLPGSPAIDAGDNTGTPAWDQRGPGFPRIVNGIIDIGAYEYQGHPPPHRQPLPAPVSVQALGMPGGPLFGQPPALPAGPFPVPGTGAPDGQAGQPGTDPVPTAAGQLAAEAFLTADAANGQPVDPFGPLAVLLIELPTLGLSG